MTSGQWLFAVYEVSTENAIERAINTCHDVGFEVDEPGNPEESTERYHTVNITYGSHSTNLLFDLDKNRSLDEPVFSFHKMVYPNEKEGEYEEGIEAIFELTCRFATNLDAAYIPLFHSEKRSSEVLPEDRPIPEAVETPPRLGVYADEVLEGFGGVEGLFDHEPWYVAELGDGHTLVIESESPWGDWRPPTEAPYIRSARFNERGPAPDTDETDGTALSDPFAALEPGTYGTDVCVDPDDIAAEFRNEDLELVRVSVDEERNLRRVHDDSFVRNVVADGPQDDVAFVKAMLADVPSDAAGADPRVSALLNDAIPPSFVRTDGPEAETVASRVLALPVNTSKIELLVSLGRAVRQGEAMDVATIESALENLAKLDDPREIEQYIENNLV